MKTCRHSFAVIAYGKRSITESQHAYITRTRVTAYEVYGHIFTRNIATLKNMCNSYPDLLDAGRGGLKTMVPFLIWPTPPFSSVSPPSRQLSLILAHKAFFFPLPICSEC